MTEWAAWGTTVGTLALAGATFVTLRTSNRSARIALVEYEDKQKAYILAPDGLKAGDRILSGEEAEPRVGNCLPLRRIPLGMSVHNLEMQPGRGGQLCRSAGTSATLTARDGRWAQITLPSGEVRRVSSECRATIGMIGNAEHMTVSLGKGSANRCFTRTGRVSASL